VDKTGDLVGTTVSGGTFSGGTVLVYGCLRVAAESGMGYSTILAVPRQMA
jgi:hypothetical protein